MLFQVFQALHHNTQLVCVLLRTPGVFCESSVIFNVIGVLVSCSPRSASIIGKCCSKLCSKLFKLCSETLRGLGRADSRRAGLCMGMTVCVVTGEVRVLLGTFGRVLYVLSLALRFSFSG